jgi:hypothetical protein
MLQLGSIFAVIDGDGQMPVSDIPFFIKLLKKGSLIWLKHLEHVDMTVFIAYLFQKHITYFLTLCIYLLLSP